MTHPTTGAEADRLWGWLPDDWKIHALSLLSVEDLARVEAASRSFRDMSAEAARLVLRGVPDQLPNATQFNNALEAWIAQAEHDGVDLTVAANRAQGDEYATASARIIEEIAEQLGITSWEITTIDHHDAQWQGVRLEYERLLALQARLNPGG